MRRIETHPRRQPAAQSCERIALFLPLSRRALVDDATGRNDDVIRVKFLPAQRADRLGLARAAALANGVAPTASTPERRIAVELVGDVGGGDSCTWCGRGFVPTREARVRSLSVSYLNPR